MTFVQVGGAVLSVSVIFTLLAVYGWLRSKDRADDSRALRERMLRRDAAELTLHTLRYTYKPGAARWKPPIGPRPEFDENGNRVTQGCKAWNPPSVRYHEPLDVPRDVL